MLMFNNCGTCAPQKLCSSLHFIALSVRCSIMSANPGARDSRTICKTVVPSAPDEARREQAVRVAEMLEEAARSQKHRQGRRQ